MSRYRPPLYLSYLPSSITAFVLLFISTKLFYIGENVVGCIRTVDNSGFTFIHKYRPFRDAQKDSAPYISLPTFPLEIET